MPEKAGTAAQGKSSRSERVKMTEERQTQDRVMGAKGQVVGWVSGTLHKPLSILFALDLPQCREMD